MVIDRRGCLRATAASLAALALPRTGRAEPLQKLRYGFLDKVVSPDVINLVIPEQLGFNRQEGISVEAIPLGSSPTVMAALATGRVEFGLGVPSFQVPLVAQGQTLPAVNFFEHTYPFKWDIAVGPDSTIRSLAELKGKRIGVPSFAQSTYPVGRAMVALAGLDPDKDVSWLAVGEGVSAGIAVARQDVDALSYFDTGFGTISQAGITLRMLPRPPKVPDVGGFYIAATPGLLHDHRNWAVAFARGVAKAALFARTNPAAAAYLFIQMFPEAAPKNRSLQEQVQAITVPLSLRMKLYRSYDPNVTQWGYIDPAEWREEVKFAGAESKIPDPSIFYTDDLIAEVNQFDQQAVKDLALSFPLPFKQG
jgi:NitT/TauT family transport system substrate-binding protein